MQDLKRHSTTAKVTTEHASRYLQQLCKHWAHRFPVTFDAQQGTVEFSAVAAAEFSVDGGALILRIYHADAAELPRMETVVADHLRRFAFREDLTIDWSVA